MNFNYIDYVLCQKHKFYAYLHARRVITNLNEVLFFLTGLSKMVEIRLKDGQKVTIRNRVEFDKFLVSPNFREQFLKNAGVDISKVNSSKIMLRFQDNLKLSFYYRTKKEYVNVLYTMYDLFVLNAYAQPNIKGKDVLDIGANIGDSAIYFAIKGAKHVYAFEPYPHTFAMAKKNVELNKLEDKITLFNEAIEKSNNKIILTTKRIHTGGLPIKNFKHGKSVKVNDLNRITKKLGLKNAILKIDTEGGEYNTIIYTPDSVLRRFSEIIMEYHYGYKNLEKRLLKAGFRVHHSIPDIHGNIVSGIIYARRVDS